MIMPFGRRHAGEGLKFGFWAAIAISLSAWGLLFAVWFLIGSPP
jgi:hypothetical protein